MQISMLPPFQGFALQPVPIEDPGQTAVLVSEGEFADVLESEFAGEITNTPAARPEDALPVDGYLTAVMVPVIVAMPVVPMPVTQGQGGDAIPEQAHDAWAGGEVTLAPMAARDVERDTNPDTFSSTAVELAEPVEGHENLPMRPGEADAIPTDPTKAVKKSSAVPPPDGGAAITGKAMVAMNFTAWPAVEEGLKAPNMSTFKKPSKIEAELGRSPVQNEQVLPSGDEKIGHVDRAGSALAATPEFQPGPVIEIQHPREPRLVENSLPTQVRGDVTKVSPIPMDERPMTNVEPSAAGSGEVFDRVPDTAVVAPSAEAETQVELRSIDSAPTPAGKWRELVARWGGQSWSERPVEFAQQGGVEQTANADDLKKSDLIALPNLVPSVESDAENFQGLPESLAIDRGWTVAQHQVMGAVQAASSLPVGTENFSAGVDSGSGPVWIDPSRPPSDAKLATSDVSGQISRAMVEKPGLVELTLTPEELGRIRFEIQQTGEQLRMVLTAERPETLDHLRRHLPEFIADLRQTGFTGSDISFGQWSRGSGDSSSGWNGAFHDSQQNRQRPATNPWQHGEEAETVRNPASSTSNPSLDLGQGRLAIRV